MPNATSDPEPDPRRTPEPAPKPAPAPANQPAQPGQPAPQPGAGPAPAEPDAQLDETKPGGDYVLADGTHVNAYGQPVKDQTTQADLDQMQLEAELGARLPR